MLFQILVVRILSAMQVMPWHFEWYRSCRRGLVRVQHLTCLALMPTVAPLFCYSEFTPSS